MSALNISIGIERTVVCNIDAEIEYRLSQKVNYLAIPLFHPRLRTDDIGISAERIGSETRSDRTLTCKEWTSNFVAKLSPWIDCDNVNSKLRSASQQRLLQELAWSNHIGIKSIILPQVRDFHAGAQTHLLRMLGKHLAAGSPVHQQLILPIPLVLPLTSVYALPTNTSTTLTIPASSSAPMLDGSWDAYHFWHNLRSQLGYHGQLSTALLLTNDLLGFLEEVTQETYLQRWVAEPVKFIIVPTSLFFMNDANFPVLSKGLQQLVRHFMKHSIGVMLRGKSHHSSKELYPYVQYLHHLQQKEEALIPTQDKMNRAFWDALQTPLQPLMDNLESQTYETFETDPVKYARYEAAVVKGLEYIIEQRKRAAYDEHRMQTDAMEEKLDHEVHRRPVIVMVVGAGRGPLVAATIGASHSTNIPVKIYAVEKNPNAVITLRNRVITEMWSKIVTVVAKDMRRWNPPELADILVSELLGSFGDNELSPECLDGAQHILLKTGGISIPESYTSYLQPVSCPLHWMAARDMFSTNASSFMISLSSSLFQSSFTSSSQVHGAVAGAGHMKGLETPYVVKFHRYCPLDSPKSCWTFLHPNEQLQSTGEYPDNTRYCRLSFESRISGIIHGFAGYFHCELFHGETISIEPSTFSEGMFSWFPIYFPLVVPMAVKRGEIITVDMWRCVDEHRVWYEWALISPQPGPVQNIQGRSSCVGL